MDRPWTSSTSRSLTSTSQTASSWATWLYQHVAQAYLELGDSYRQDADEAERRARREELEQAAERLRAEALEREGKK